MEVAPKVEEAIYDPRKVQFQVDKSHSLPLLDVKGVDKFAISTVKPKESKQNDLMRSDSQNKGFISFLPMPRRGIDEEDEKLGHQKHQKKHQKNLDWAVE